MAELKQTFAIGGENLIDHVTSHGQVSAKVGGSPFNVAMGLGRLGAQVSYVSPISTDPWGGKLASALRASGVHLSGGRLDLPTTMARVEVEHGHPTYRFEREGTAERAVDLATISARISAADAVHTGSLTLTKGADAQAWEDAMAQAFQRGQFVSLDPNVRMSVVEDEVAYRMRILRMCKTVHCLKLSDEDLAELFPAVSIEEAISALRQHSAAALIVLTKGSKGAVAFGPSGQVATPAAPVARLVDAVGAGDTFTASLLWGLASQGHLSPTSIGSLSSATLMQILTYASAAAAINCGREGCDPPTLAVLERTLV